MMQVRKDDFVELDIDLYANGTLVQTTSEEKGKSAGLDVKEYGPQVIIVGREFILKALDENIEKNKVPDKETVVELTAENAYGKRKKEMLKVFPKSAFDEHKTRPVVGVVYDFNGMYGIVKSVVGGRVMVDFNNPLAGKDIKIVYKVVKKIDDMKVKIEKVLEMILKIPKNMFEVAVKEKNVLMKLPEQLEPIKEMIKKTLGEYISDFKDFSVKIERFKK